MKAIYLLLLLVGFSIAQVQPFYAVPDTNSLKTMEVGLGSAVYMQGYSAGNVNGAGVYLVIDSAYAEGSYAFDHPTRGYQWYLNQAVSVANNAVDSSKIAAGAVQTSDLADSSVTSAKIVTAVQNELIPTVADTTALKAKSGSINKKVYLSEISIGAGVGGGDFVYKSSGYTADKGTVFSANGGGYFVRKERILKTDITPQMFGVSGDGTTDDSDNLQHFFDACFDMGGNKVFFPPASDFVISKTLYVPDVVMLHGNYGHTDAPRDVIRFYWEGGRGDTMLVVLGGQKRPSSSDKRVYRHQFKYISLDGDGYTNSDTAGYGIVYWDRVENGTIIDQSAFNTFLYNAVVYRAGGTKVAITETRFDRILGDAIKVDSVGTMLNIQNCYYDNAGYDSTGAFVYFAFGDNNSAFGKLNVNNLLFEKNSSIYDSLGLFYFEFNENYTDNVQYEINVQNILRGGSISTTAKIINFSQDAGGKVSITGMNAPLANMDNGGFAPDTTNGRKSRALFVYQPYEYTGASETINRDVEIQANTMITPLSIGLNGSKIDSAKVENGDFNFYRGSSAYKAIFNPGDLYGFMYINTNKTRTIAVADSFYSFGASTVDSALNVGTFATTSNFFFNTSGYSYSGNYLIELDITFTTADTATVLAKTEISYTGASLGTAQDSMYMAAATSTGTSDYKHLHIIRPFFRNTHPGVGTITLTPKIANITGTETITVRYASFKVRKME